MIRSKINSEQLRPFLMALVIVGIVALLFGAYRFVDAATRIQNNPAFQVQSNGQTVSPQDMGTAEMLVSSGLAYRELVRQRNEALVIGGVGLVMLSLGWLGNDVIRSRRKVVKVS
jgi:hypothetical protein